MSQVITAAALLVLPVFSEEFTRGRILRLRHSATLLGLSLAAITLIFAGVIWVVDKPLERLLFGGKFSEYSELMPLFILMTTAVGLCLGWGMALRASRKTHFDLIANGAAAPVAIASAYFFTKAWGLAGAAISVTTGFAVQCVVTFICFYTLLPRPKRLKALGMPRHSVGNPVSPQ
jgi:O-antigen/teichoic acid export membrane protein